MIKSVAFGLVMATSVICNAGTSASEFYGGLIYDQADYSTAVGSSGFQLCPRKELSESTCGSNGYGVKGVRTFLGELNLKNKHNQNLFEVLSEITFTSGEVIHAVHPRGSDGRGLLVEKVEPAGRYLRLMPLKELARLSCVFRDKDKNLLSFSVLLQREQGQPLNVVKTQAEYWESPNFRADLARSIPENCSMAGNQAMVCENSVMGIMVNLGTTSMGASNGGPNTPICIAGECGRSGSLVSMEGVANFKAQGSGFFKRSAYDSAINCMNSPW